MERILQEKNHIIYKIAISQNRAYVEDPNFRLRFLRANDHDAQKSANQMVAFLTRKEKYFGREKLTKDITHYDLSQEDMNLLRSGVYHIQDEVDRNGRMVVYLLNHSFSTKPKAESLVRHSLLLWKLPCKMLVHPAIDSFELFCVFHYFRPFGISTKEGDCGMLL